MSEVIWHYTMNVFYLVKMSASPIHSPSVYGFNPDAACRPRAVFFRLVRDDSTISNPRNRRVLTELCQRRYVSADIHLTYSSIVNVKLPPPYDTDCLDYRK